MGDLALSAIAELMKAADLPFKASRKISVPALGTLQGMTGAFERRLWEINSTQNAACAGDIAADYQPIINAQSGVFEGVEALVRWHHPTLGFLARAVVNDLTA